jgi:hypothetical protein
VTDGVEVDCGALDRDRRHGGAGRSERLEPRLAAHLHDLEAVCRQDGIQVALEAAERDPEDAITAACSMLEAVCRSDLAEFGQELPAKKNIQGLVKAVQEPLGLSPARTDLPSEIAGDVRQVLQGLATAAAGIGALRTHGRDAHGRERGRTRVDARIARLAIHAASTLALFLVETWERTQRRALPNRTEGAAD